jgi:addiction module RelB/DinJ family antitoxin
MKTLNKTSTIQVRISPKIKEAAIRIFKKENLEMSYVIQKFLEEVVSRKMSGVTVPKFAIPFDSRFKDWKEEMDFEIANSKKYKSAKEMISDSENW